MDLRVELTKLLTACKYVSPPTEAELLWPPPEINIRRLDDVVRLYNSRLISGGTVISFVPWI